MSRSTLPTTLPPSSPLGSPNPKDSKIITLSALSHSTPTTVNYQRENLPSELVKRSTSFQISPPQAATSTIPITTMSLSSIRDSASPIVGSSLPTILI